MKTQIYFKTFIFSKEFIFLIITFLSFCSNLITIPFIIKNPYFKGNDNLITASQYLKYMKNNLIGTKIYMGTPPKEIEAYLTMEQYDFFLGKGFCLSNSNSQYNSSLSTSYQKTMVSFFSPIINNGSFSKENFFFYNELDFSQNKSINDLEFIYGIASPDFFDMIDPELNCGYIGLQMSSGSEYFESNSLIYGLKMSNLIGTKKWSIIFYENNKKINNYDGALILGLKEEDYINIFNINNNSDYSTIYSLPYIMKNVDWEIKFDEIYYEINNQNYSFDKYIQGNFIIDYNYIISNKDFFDSIKNNFFNKYINEGICYLDKNETLKKTKKTDIRILNIIICDKNKFKDMNKFPNLYFKHINLNKIFELNYKDLFIEIGNSIIFSIIMDEEEKYHWSFGRIFMKKYQFIFDNDQKTITYIKKNIIDDEENENTNNTNGNSNNNNIIIILKILLIVFLIVGFGVGLFLGKKIWDKNKKKRANELNDDYDYIESNIQKKDDKNAGLFEENK